MVVNPRTVAPGWALRWPKEAFLLMSRAWILWMGTAALLAAACELLVDMGILRLLFWVIGLFVMLLSTGFARLSREIFVDGGGNRKRAARTVSNSISNTVANAA